MDINFALQPCSEAKKKVIELRVLPKGVTDLCIHTRMADSGPGRDKCVKGADIQEYNFATTRKAGPHSSGECAMEFVTRLNIERYEKLLEPETDREKRAVLQLLLEKE